MALPSLSLPFTSRPWLTRKNRIERAYRFRHALEGLLAFLLLLGLAALSVAWVTEPSPWMLVPLGPVIVLFLVAAGLWLALPAWFRPGFRWLAWRASLLVGRIRSLRYALPAAGAVLIALTVLAGWWLYSLEGSEGAKEVTISLISILLLWSILFVRVRARKRFFVADFVNHAKVGEEDCGKAIAARLRNELSSIAALYRSIDEILPSQTRKKTHELSVGVQDTGTEFKEVMGSGFTVPLFGIQLPVGTLVSLLGGRFWSPRLTGSLHQEGDRLVLVAEIGGAGREGSWRVSTDDLAEEDRPRTGMFAVYKLVEQMAYRVLTSQADIGSPRWEAVRSFTEGLRAYRRVQRTEKDRTIYLRKAEREFIRARNEDNNFVQCHYDLGVVYQQLGQVESAEAAFRQAIEKDPSRFEPYYGLATIHYWSGNFQGVWVNAEKALQILPLHAATWNIEGLATLFVQGETETEEAWRSILQDFGIATGLAWRSLCREIVRGDPDSPAAQASTDLAQLCAGNLAYAVAQRAKCLSLGNVERRRSAGLARHALCLQPHDPHLHLTLGMALFQARDWSRAKEAFDEAFVEELDPSERALCLAYLAATLAHLNDPYVHNAYHTFLDFAVPPEETVLTAESRRDLPQDPYPATLLSLSKELEYYIGGMPGAFTGKDYFEAMKRAVSFLHRLETSMLDESRLNEECEQLDEDDRSWGQAQIGLRLARRCLEGDPVDASDRLHKAILALDGQGHGQQIAKQGLYTLLARAYLLRAKLPRDRDLLRSALKYAENSARQEPDSAVRRWVVSEAYSALKDFEQVSQESDTSLALGSAEHLLTDPEALTYLAENWLQQVSDLHSQGPWKQAIERGCAFLDHIRELIESMPIDPRQMVVHALLHHWLGRFHCELKGCDAGIAQLEIAIRMGARPVESRLILGRAYAEVGAFTKAEQTYLSAFPRALRPKPSPEKKTQDPGEALKDKRPLDELQVEILLHLALLYVHTGSNLWRAALLADLIRWKMKNGNLPKRREYKALHHEVLGRLFLLRGQADASIAELERSRELWSSASTCYHLATAYETKARLGRDKEGALAKAAALCDQADRLDMPQRYHQRLDDLRERLKGPKKPKEEWVLVPFPSTSLKEIGKGAGAN